MPHCRMQLALGGAVVAAALLLPTAGWCQSAAAAESREETAELRASLAEEIVAAREHDSGRAFDPELRRQMAKGLRGLPLESLEAAARGQDVNEVFQKALAFTKGKLVYTPVNPCRILDTRLYGLPIAPGQTRAISLTATSVQGGSPTGCGIPFGKALAVMVNFVAVNPAGSGHLQAWPWSDPATEPEASSVINYSLGNTIANAIILPTCDITAGPCGLDFFLRANVSATDVVGDVVGYFTANNLDDARISLQPTMTSTPYFLPPLAATCTAGPPTSANVNYRPSHVIVRALVRVRIDHVQGVTDDIRLCLAETAGDCSACQTAAAAVYTVPGAWPSASGIEVTLPLEQVFNVTGNSEAHNYFVNGLAPSGSASADRILGASFVTESAPDIQNPF